MSKYLEKTNKFRIYKRVKLEEYLIALDRDDE